MPKTDLHIVRAFISRKQKWTPDTTQAAAIWRQHAQNHITTKLLLLIRRTMFCFCQITMGKNGFGTICMIHVPPECLTAFQNAKCVVCVCLAFWCLSESLTCLSCYPPKVVSVASCFRQIAGGASNKFSCTNRPLRDALAKKQTLFDNFGCLKVMSKIRQRNEFVFGRVWRTLGTCDQRFLSQQ